MSTQQVCSGKVLLARRLSEKLAGLLEVSYLDGAFQAEGSPSSGRQFLVSFCEPDESCLVLDDREPESLARQVVAELRRVAQLHANAAEIAERRLGLKVA